MNQLAKLMALIAYQADQGGNGGGVSVVNPAAGFLNAEARRTLDQAVWSSGKVVTVDIPRDTVIKRMALSMTAIFDVTYSSGNPVTSEFGIFSRLCPQVEVIINGSRVVKSVNPHLLRLHSQMVSGACPRRAYSLSASAPTTQRASREWMSGNVVYSPTTEFMLFNEMAPLSFELPWGYAGSRYDTELDVRDVSNASLKFYFAAISNVLQDGNAASVTYGNSNIFVSTQIIENRARPRPVDGQILYDYVESTIARNISGQQKGYQIDLQTGNFLAGIGIMTQNGDSGKSLAENLLQNINLKINGSTAIQGPVSQKDLQDDNVSRFGCNDLLGFDQLAATIKSVADTHPLKGFSFMNLLRNGDWNTAINTSRQAAVDTIKLEFDTPAASGTDAATYTNPVQVTCHTHEIRPFAYKR